MFVLTNLISQDAVRTHNAIVTPRSTNASLRDSESLIHRYPLCKDSNRFFMEMYQKTLPNNETPGSQLLSAPQCITPGNLRYSSHWLLVIHFYYSFTQYGLSEQLSLCVSTCSVLCQNSLLSTQFSVTPGHASGRNWLCCVTMQGSQLQRPKLYGRNVGLSLPQESVQTWNLNESKQNHLPIA